MRVRNFKSLKIIKKFLKKIFIFLIGFVFCIVLSVLFEGYSEVFISVFNLIFISYITMSFFSFAGREYDKREIKKLQKDTSSNTNKQLLYQFIGRSSVDHSFLFAVTKGKVKLDLLENLNEIKWKIKHKVGPNLNDYYLLKNYLIVYEKNNILDKFSTLFIGLIIGILTGFLSKLVTSEKVINSINGFIHNTNTIAIPVTVSNILDFSVFIIVVTNMFIYILNEFTKEKRQIAVINAIIDSIIEEKKAERLTDL